MEIQKKIKEKNALYPAIKTSMKRKYLIWSLHNIDYKSHMQAIKTEDNLAPPWIIWWSLTSIQSPSFHICMGLLAKPRSFPLSSNKPVSYNLSKRILNGIGRQDTRSVRGIIHNWKEIWWCFGAIYASNHKSEQSKQQFMTFVYASESSNIHWCSYVLWHAWNHESWCTCFLS